MTFPAKIQSLWKKFFKIDLKIVSQSIPEVGHFIFRCIQRLDSSQSVLGPVRFFYKTSAGASEPRRGSLMYSFFQVFVTTSGAPFEAIPWAKHIGFRPPDASSHGIWWKKIFVPEIFFVRKSGASTFWCLAIKTQKCLPEMWFWDFLSNYLGIS